MSESPAPLRVLHLTAGSDAGGVSRYVHDLCQAMHAQGHRVAVAGERGAWHRLFADAPWPWIDLPLKGSPVALWRTSRALRRWLERNPVDVIHTHYRRPTLVARRVQRFEPVPILYTVHLTDVPMTWPWRSLTDFGDHTHVASEEAHEWTIGAGASPDNVTLIHHGIDVAQYPQPTDEQRRLARESLGLTEDDLVAAYVGRLDDPKNEGWLVDLAMASQQRLPNLKVLITGEGPHERRLHDRIEQRGLIERVRLLGHREPLPIYQAADALLLPSSREGFGYSCAEAMCAGVPVLRTRTAGAQAMIVENVTGRTCPIDRRAFVEAAIEFLSDATALKRMGHAAAQHIRQHFPFDRQVARTIDLYRRVCTLLLPGPGRSTM